MVSVSPQLHFLLKENGLRNNLRLYFNLTLANTYMYIGLLHIYGHPSMVAHIFLCNISIGDKYCAGAKCLDCKSDGVAALYHLMTASKHSRVKLSTVMAAMARLRVFRVASNPT